MARIFISHSRRDRELTSNLVTALENIGAQPVAIEYMPTAPTDTPDWTRIRNEVALADFVMLFKTDNAIASDFTKSWIIFEVGLAAAMGKRLLVFERRGEPISFPIPYVTDYMLFNPNEVPDFLRVQGVAKEIQDEVKATAGSGKKRPKTGNAWGFVGLALFAPEVLATLIVLGIVALGVAGVVSALQGPIPISCRRCHAGYRYYGSVFSPLRCPICLTEIDPSADVDEETLTALRALRDRLSPEGE